jgi:hypothetical protein
MLILKRCVSLSRVEHKAVTKQDFWARVKGIAISKIQIIAKIECKLLPKQKLQGNTIIILTLLRTKNRSMTIVVKVSL